MTLVQLPFSLVLACMRCEGESRFAVDLEWIATASILVRVAVEDGRAAVIPLCRDVVRMRRFFFGGVTA